MGAGAGLSRLFHIYVQKEKDESRQEAEPTHPLPPARPSVVKAPCCPITTTNQGHRVQTLKRFILKPNKYASGYINIIGYQIAQTLALC